MRRKAAEVAAAIALTGGLASIVSRLAALEINQRSGLPMPGSHANRLDLERDALKLIEGE